MLSLRREDRELEILFVQRRIKKNRTEARWKLLRRRRDGSDGYALFDISRDSAM